MRNGLRFAYLTAALLLAACTADYPAEAETESEGAVIYPRLSFGVSDMTMSAVSRASEPLSPDQEKYVKTIAVFEFDNEGLHEKRSTAYHFIDFVAGTVDGIKGVGSVEPTEFGIVETTLDGLAFEAYSDGMICLVANVTEEQVDEFYDKYREPGQSFGRITFTKFREWALPFIYAPRWTDVYDDSRTGHIRDMYMFGYYQGKIEPKTPEAIWIDLGRLASRLDITIVNKTGADITKRLGYHLDNVCIAAYFFPMKMGLPAIDSLSIARTIICSGPTPVAGDSEKHKIVPEKLPADSVHTHYFYVAAHSAQNDKEATTLHIFYDRDEIPRKDNENGEPGSFEVPLCNVHPSQAADIFNGYSLSRNTRYHFTIYLKKKGEENASSRAVQEQSVEYGDRPGEITVYLP